MITKIKTLILSLSLLFAFGAPVLVASPVFADDQVQTNINHNLACGSNLDLSSPSTAGCPNSTTPSTFPDILRKVINVMSVLIGAIAVIMIIFGGFRYVTSAGNEQGVTAAKKTIMYALIGLVIVALAQVIVHFVLSNVT
jgi:hypothetical protein